MGVEVTGEGREGWPRGEAKSTTTMGSWKQS